MGAAALDPLSRWGGELLRLPDVAFAAPERIWLAVPLALVLLLTPLLRRHRSRSAALALLLRAAALGALLALLLEPHVEERETRTGRLVVLADVSPSVGDAGRSRAESYLAQAGAPFDLVAFGATPSLRGEGVQGASLEPDPRMATDIAAALRIAAVRAGPAEPLRIVLFSDGRATRPGSEQAALRLRSRAAELFAFAIPEAPAAAAPAFTAERLEVPPRSERSAPFAVRALVRASAPASATATLFVDGERAALLDAELVEGENEIRFGNVSLAPGRHEVQVLVAGDASAEDNLAGAEVEVPGVPRVLCLAAADRRSLVAMALAKQGLEVDVRAASQMPDLSTYDAVVILPDAPVRDLEERAGALSEFVLRQGGGLLAIGGREGPGLARLAGSPVAFLLPLEVEPRTAPTRPKPEPVPERKPRTEIVEEEREAFPITLCLVVDRSGSMEASFKLRQAKVAAVAAAASLTPEDRMALLAFGDKAEVVLPPSPAREDRRVGAAVASLTSEGHTAMFAALSLAHAVMLEEKTPIRHVVLITDGIATDDGRWRDLVNAMAEEGITLSTVGIGLDVDGHRLGQLARWGKGRYWLAQPHEIPQVVTQDTLRVVKARDKRGEDAERAPPEEPTEPPPPEEPTPPEPPPPPPAAIPIVPDPAAPRDMLKGLEDEELPRVAAPEESKPRFASWIAARAGPEGPPLVAYGRLGLGTAAALTVDPEAPSERELREHPELPRLMAQLLRSVLPDARGEPFVLVHEVVPARDEDLLALRVVGEDGRPRTDVEVEAVLDGAPLTLVRRADRYEALLPARAGSVRVSVRVGAHGRQQLARDFVVPPSGNVELARTGPDRATLLRLVGDRHRVDARPRAALQRPEAVVARTRPIPLPFLLLAAILLPVDAWVRRRVRSASR